MKGDLIPHSDTISRYCAPMTLSEKTGKPTGQSFIRKSDLRFANPHISVNWLEYFSDKEKSEQIEAVRAILSKKMKLAKNAKLTLMKVGSIHEQFALDPDLAVRVLHWPDDQNDDPSHAGIFDIESDPDVIGDMLAIVEAELLPARR